MSTKAHQLIQRSAERITLVTRGPVHARGQACEKLAEIEQEMYKAMDDGWTWMDTHEYPSTVETRWHDLRRQYERTVDTRKSHCTASPSPGDDS